MLETVLAVLYIGYAAFVWRLRGGAWQNVGVFMGTNVTRFVTGILLAAPIAVLDDSWLLYPTLSAAITLGLMIAGWGSYMGMGEHVRMNDLQWSDWPARLLRIRQESVLWDCLGMATVITPMFTLILLSFGMIVGLSMLGGVVCLTGIVLFTFAYWVVSRVAETKLPIVYGTTGNGMIAGHSHNAWAEFASGGVIGLTLLTLSAIL
jgi:hypothetical protein